MSPPLDRSLPTIARVFSAAGYETAYFGKWHLGGVPGDYGFDSHDTKVDDRTLADRVIAFLRRRATPAPGKPLLLIVAWLNPHDVYGALKAKPDARLMESARLPANLADPLDDKPFPQRHYLEHDQGRPFVGAPADVWRRYRAFYNGLVETVDREMGGVVDAMPRRAVPPIVLFSSDHGDLGGAHGLPFKGPAMYEELVRVPLVISWPGRIRPASSDALVSLIDVMPTLCDLAGVEAPAAVDGLSLRPIVAGRPRDWRRDMIFSEYYGKQSWRVPIRMVRTSRWKYVRYLEYGEELYDLAADPGELRNLAREPRAASAASAEAAASRERTRLARALDDWIKRTADPFPRLTVTDRAGRVIAAQ